MPSRTFALAFVLAANLCACARGVVRWDSVDGSASPIDATHGDVPQHDVADDAAGAVHRVFVTSLAFQGDLVSRARDIGATAVTGVDAANALCNNLAQAAGLSGTWAAWISSAMVPAIDNVGASNGPWMRIDGAMVFRNRANLETVPIVAITLDEHGESISDNTLVWTATAVGGRWNVDDCSSWVSTRTSPSTFSPRGAVGDSTRTNEGWTDAAASPGSIAADCSTAHRLYCFER